MSEKPAQNTTQIRTGAKESKTFRPACGPWPGLVSALVAGAIFFGIVQFGHPVFTVPQELIDRMPTSTPPSSAQFAEMKSAKATAGNYNMIMFIGLYGALLGGLLAMTERFCRYPTEMGQAGASTWSGMVFSVVVGGVVGCVAGELGHLVSEFMKTTTGLSPLVKTIIGQGVLWITLGAGIGVVFGAFARGGGATGRCLLHGVLAGLLGAMAYPMVIAILHPAANTSLILPKEWSSRLWWIGISAILMGLLIPSSLNREKGSEACPQTGSE